MPMRPKVPTTVNEALATGLPCVVSHAVGCAPDLIRKILAAGTPAALSANSEVRRVYLGDHFRLN